MLVPDSVRVASTMRNPRPRLDCKSRSSTQNQRPWYCAAANASFGPGLELDERTCTLKTGGLVSNAGTAPNLHCTPLLQIIVRYLDPHRGFHDDFEDRTGEQSEFLVIRLRRTECKLEFGLLLIQTEELLGLRETGIVGIEPAKLYRILLGLALLGNRSADAEGVRLLQLAQKLEHQVELRIRLLSHELGVAGRVQAIDPLHRNCEDGVEGLSRLHELEDGDWRNRREQAFRKLLYPSGETIWRIER
jgi:hypothetical protein